MKSFTQFIKTTMLGGLIFLVPLFIVTIVLAKAHGLMVKVAKPFSALIPLDSIGGVAIANILAILAILLCCLLEDIGVSPYTVDSNAISITDSQTV